MTFPLRTKEMKQHLLNRGYTKGCINDAINKASTVTREDSLKEKIEQQKMLSQVTNMELGGIVCVLLRLSILRRKSLSSFRY